MEARLLSMARWEDGGRVERARWERLRLRDSMPLEAYLDVRTSTLSSTLHVMLHFVFMAVLHFPGP